MTPNNRSHAICFDIGNTLIQLGPPVNSWLAPKNNLELKELLNAYSLGNVPTQRFLQSLKSLRQNKLEAIPFEEWFINKRLIGPYPGATRLLSSLVERGKDIILFSNTNELHWSLIQTYSFAHTHKYLSFQMHRKKPDPCTFKGVESLICRPSQDIIFFDDSAINVDTAIRLSWNGHRVSDPNPVKQIIQILNERYHIDVND